MSVGFVITEQFNIFASTTNLHNDSRTVGIKIKVSYKDKVFKKSFSLFDPIKS